MSSAPIVVFVIAQPPRLLLHEGQLPQTVLSTDSSWSAVTAVNAAAAEVFGPGLHVRQPLSVLSGCAPERRLYALETPEGWSPPPGMAWGTLETALPTDDPLYGPIQAHLAAAAEGREPWCEWYRPGWLGAARAWIHNRLYDAYLEPTGEPEPLHWSGDRVVLSVPTQKGPYGFKALAPPFRHEAALLRWLEKAFPQETATPAALDAWRRWLIVPDLQAYALSSSIEIETWQGVLRRYAQMQAATSVRLNELVGMAVPDLRLYQIESRLEGLLNRPAAALSGLRVRLEEDELAQLRRRIPQFKAGLAELSSQYGIPAALVHGRFLPEQIAVRGTHFLYSDWACAAISHPFFSLAQFLRAPLPPLGVTDAREMLRNAYLEPWSAYEPLPALLRIMERVSALEPLMRAIQIHDLILPSIEARWELLDDVALHLRLLLELS